MSASSAVGRPIRHAVTVPHVRDAIEPVRRPPIGCRPPWPTLVCFPRPSRRRVHRHRRRHGQGERRRAPGRARRRHARASTARCADGFLDDGRDAGGAAGAVETQAAADDPRRRPRRVPRLRRLGDDRHARERPARARSGRPTSRRRRRGWPPSSREEAADVLTCYDEIGGYGHPDHIQVHRVGLRAAELAGTPKVFQSTINRDAHHPADEATMPAARGRRRARLRGRPELRHARGGHHVRGRRDARSSTASATAMQAHASQIAENHFMLDDARRGVRAGLRHGVVHPRRPGPGHHRRRPRSDDRGVDAHRVRPADRLRCRSGAPAARAAPHDRRAAGPARDDRGPARQRRRRQRCGGRIGIDAGVDVRRASSRTCRRRSCRTGSAAGPCRRGRRHRVLRRRQLRRPRQGRRASSPSRSRASRRRRGSTGPRCRTCRSRRRTRAPSSRRSSG